MEKKITYKDIKEHEKLFTLAPPFLLEAFAKKNTNLVLKFKSAIQSHIDNLSDIERDKLDLILQMEVQQLQELMAHAYKMTSMKQYKILSNPKYKKFIEDNINEIRKMRR